MQRAFQSRIGIFKYSGHESASGISQWCSGGYCTPTFKPIGMVSILHLGVTEKTPPCIPQWNAEADQKLISYCVSRCLYQSDLHRLSTQRAGQLPSLCITRISPYCNSHQVDMLFSWHACYWASASDPHMRTGCYLGLNPCTVPMYHNAITYAYWC